jgi:hypothetical protein
MSWAIHLYGFCKAITRCFVVIISTLEDLESFVFEDDMTIRLVL